MVTATRTLSPLAEDELRTDTYVWPTMTRLAECLCTEIAAAGLPPTCLCGLMPGRIVDTSYVTPKEGMAYVRLNGAYTSSTFPAQSVSEGNCGLPLAFELEVGALWCAPVARDSRGNPPTMEAQFAATEVQVAAMGAMYRAVQCCNTAERRTRIAVGRYTPVGPMGGVVGGTWQIYVDQRGL